MHCHAAIFPLRSPLGGLDREAFSLSGDGSRITAVSTLFRFWPPRSRAPRKGEIHIVRPTCRGRAQRDDRLNCPSLVLNVVGTNGMFSYRVIMN